MYKKVNALYFSATGMVKKVVSEIVKNIDEEFTDYNITLEDSRKENKNFTSDDLVIVGVPVYAGRIPKLVADYFEKVKGDNTLAVFIVVYGNRDYEDALVELRDILESNGFIGLAACSFVGEHSYTSKVATSRPDDMDLEIAKDFSERIKKKLEKMKSIDDLEFLFIKGNYPYRDRKVFKDISPETNESCIKCSICAKFCPTTAISFDDFTLVDSKKCILCCSCIKRCPVDAKTMNNGEYNSMRERLIENFSKDRKEPELFI